MNAGEFEARFESEWVVPIAPDEWPALAALFTEVERHATGFAADLVVLQRGEVYAALEQPPGERWVVRRLGERAEADRFVADRLAQYERMWDGCGCRVDYFSRGGKA